MTIAFMRVLHRSEFFKVMEIARRGFLRQSTLTSCTMRWGPGNMIEHFKSPLPTSASGEGADRASRLRGFHWRKSALRDEGHMDANDKYACAELIQAWGLYRDQGKWPQLLATFVPEGEIAVSWFSGSFREFVDRCRRGRAAFPASDFFIRRAPRGRSRARRDQYRHPGAPEDCRYARRHDVVCALPRPAGAARGTLGHCGARRHLRARPARRGRAVGGFRQAVRGKRTFDLSGGLPLHGRPPQRRRARARAGRPLRRLPAYGATLRALRRMARREVANSDRRGDAYVRRVRSARDFGLVGRLTEQGHRPMSNDANDGATEVRMTVPQAPGTNHKPPLKVLLCSPRGFCAGVVRAIDTVEQALARYGAPVYVRHE